jgi:6-pyruvoyltetrahydropterin/6-carboxytetrahydropterin synthase
MTYQSTKTYGHEVGLSCAFRQHKAKSHCSKVHGYALSFKFTFEADQLDLCNWVMDFGGLKSLKEMLQSTFDHKLLVASDDPFIETFLLLREQGAADVLIVGRVGCEAFAEMGYMIGQDFLNRHPEIKHRVRLVSVEVCEHGANSALYIGK